MPYVPDATQITEPTDAEKASTMGLEFRTLKAYIQSVLLPLITAAGAGKAPLGGAGTSGTWPISITGNAGGNAATATAATTASSTQNVLQGGTVTTQNVLVNTSGSGKVELHAGDGVAAGYIQFRNPAGTAIAVIGFGNGGAHAFTSIDGAPWICNADIHAVNFVGNLNGLVAWTNVTGRPTLLSQFTNDIGAGGGSGVASFNSRTGAVTLSSADVTGALGYTPYSSGNPGNFTSLAAVAAAGYQTSSGGVNTATTAGNGVNSVVNATTFTGSDTGNGNDLTDVTLSLTGGVVTLTRHRSYRTAPDPGGGP